MRRGVIYKYTFPNGKIYIGQTRRNPELRKREHIDPKIGPLNSGFWEAYQQFGTYEYEILFEFASDDEYELVQILNQKETEYIAQYNATNPAYGYNKRWRGTETIGVLKKLEQKYEAIVQEIYNHERPIVDAILSKVVSHEPLSKAEKDILHNLDMAGESDKLIRHNEGTELIHDKFWIEEFSEWILFVLEEDCRIFAEEYIAENKASILQEVLEKDIILQLDINDNHIIKEFFSLAEIASEFNVKRPENVWNVLRGKQKTAYGFKWAYKYPENHK